MSDQSTPAPPPGYTIMPGPPASSTSPAPAPASAGTPPLPPGYTLDAHPEAKISDQPRAFTLPWLRSLGYTAADSILSAFPSLGAAAGGAVGAGGATLPTEGVPTPATLAGGVAGAGLGGGFGKAAEQLVRPMVFPPSKGYRYPSPGEEVGQVLSEAERQAIYEMTGQVLGRGVQVARKAIPAVRSVDGIPLAQSERTGNAATGFVEHMTERSLPSMGPMQQFRNQQTAAIERRATELADSFSAPGMTQEQRGAAIQRGIEQGQEAIRRDVSSAYQALDQMTQSRRIMVRGEPETVQSSLVGEQGQPLSFQRQTRVPALAGGAPVIPTQTRRAAASLLRELSEEEKILTPTAVQDLKSRLTAMARANQPTTFMGAQQARSDLLDLVRRNEDILATKKSRINSILSRAVDDDMSAAARRADPTGSLGIESQLRTANALAKEQHRVFEQTLVKRVIESGQPEAIAALVRKGGVQETRDLVSILRRAPVPVQGQVRTQVLNDILDDAVKASHPTQGMNLALRPNVFRGDKFAEAIHSLGNERGQAIYGAQGWGAIKRLAAITERVKPNTQDWLSLHNWVYLNAAMHPTSGYAHAALAGGAGMRVLAEAMTHPRVVDAMANYLSRVSKGFPRAVDLFVKELEVAQDPDRNKGDQP